MKNFLFYLEYLLLRSVMFLVNLFPLAWAYAFADGMGNMGYRFLKKKRAMALENVRAAFKNEKTEAETEAIARESFRSVCKLGIEFIRIPKLVRNIKKYVELKNIERGTAILKSGKGAIFMVSHLGNWELMGIRVTAEGFPLNAVARPMKNPFLYNYIKRLRGYNGLKTIDKKGAVRIVVKLLQANEVVCMLVDQRETQGGVEVDFFGRKASTGSFPAMLSLKYGAPIVPIHFWRGGLYKWKVEIAEPLEVIDTGNYVADIHANTQQFTRVVEESIRKNPGDWLWMHNRWRPAGAGK